MLTTHSSSVDEGVDQPTSEGEQEILQEHPQDAPAGWAELQDELAATEGLALLLVDGRQPPAIVASNNNSICHAFQSSPEYVSLCDPYCGDAHRRAMSAGSAVQYKCHAGLQCFTMPVQIAGRQNLAAIGGRAFVSGGDYRSLADRFRAGELNDLLPKQPFDNVIFSEEERLRKLSELVAKAARTLNKIPISNQTIATPRPAVQINVADTAAKNVPEVATTSDLQLEVERLRGELEYRSRLADSLQRFLERITESGPDKTYDAILSRALELLQAERGSLWVFDEQADELVVRATMGFTTPMTELSRIRTGEGIAGRVVESREPLVIENLENTGLTQSRLAGYKTKSFISFPITLGRRRVGLLNVADKIAGDSFSDVDVSLLEIVGPQIAIALERAEWQDRATEFQLMSITDPLTGLLNRRYLEERLTEELNRSKRHNYSVCCLMIDIDDFKKYNDRNGHQAGDVALKITAHSLKAALRSADIACRYGGEEFCVLLPQTTVTEAGVIAERMRQRVAEADYPYGKSQPLGRVSISIGISTFGHNIDTAETVIAAADRALYHAKSKGKNRIEFYIDNLTGPSTNPPIK